MAVGFHFHMIEERSRRLLVVVDWMTKCYLKYLYRIRLDQVFVAKQYGSVFARSD